MEFVRGSEKFCKKFNKTITRKNILYFFWSEHLFEYITENTQFHEHGDRE